MPVDLPMTGPFAECALDRDGPAAQRDRYAQLARSTESIERRGDELLVHFAPTLDDGVLRETVAIESECCPFLRLDYEPSERRLRIGVSSPEQLPALDALAFVFGDSDAA